MKYLYLVDYWVPFPSSEYGGIVSVIAENDEECHDLLRDCGDFDDRYTQKIMERVLNAHKFALAENEDSRIVDAFTT
jgi:hypothetical protein